MDGYRVLIADDHQANRMVVQRLLQKAGHRATCVNGGEQVLDAMEACDYDAVIIDLHMLAQFGGGQERTAAEFRALFAAAGFALTRVVPTASDMSIIEGVPS